MSNSCRQETLLSAYLDGELTEAQTAELKIHVAECHTCRRTLETLRHTDALIRDLPPLEPSAEFDRTFWEKVDALESQSRYRLWAGYLLGGWRPIWAGAIAGLAVAVLIYFGGTDPLSPEEVFIAEHMELLEDFDLIGQLEMLEHLDATDAMKELS
jgi:anti-sigma factor RsiW